VQVSTTGSGSDQPHLLGLLRAIRLRHGAAEAAAAGAADTEAALRHHHPATGTPSAAPDDNPRNGEPTHPEGLVHPHWPSATALPGAPERPALPAAHPPRDVEPAQPPGDVEPGHVRPAAAPPRPAARPPAVPAPPARLPARPDPADVDVPEAPPPRLDPVTGRAGGPAFGPMPGGTQGPPGLPLASAGVSGIGGIPGGPSMPRVGHPMPGDPVQPSVPLASAPVSMPGHPGAARPVDGMDPADDAALREMQRLLGNSLSLAGGPAEVAARLRTALAQAQPQLFAALPGSPAFQREQLAQALTWLVHNLDQPPVVVAGCGQLGAALAECGIHPPQLQLVGAALAEAMRAGMAAGGWRQEFDQAWRTTWQHAYEWIAHGEALARYQPTTWTAVVTGHERRRGDLAIIRLRPYLPMPFRPGQYARIEVADVPGVWRPYSLAGAPRRDNAVELHVRAKTEAGVSGTLVYRTTVGDTVRISRAEGAMSLDTELARDLLMIAGDTGVAPLKAMLTELAATGDPRSAVLFWGARTLDELYDIEEIAEIARAARRATVVPVISEGEAGPYASGLVTDAVAAYGEWSDHEVYLAGPPLMLAATIAALRQLGVHPDRIHHDAPEG
jgi:NAD(P)H-flavin reductase/hemoglobin-like flavoprotein